jgi:hypothetical protein
MMSKVRKKPDPAIEAARVRIKEKIAKMNKARKPRKTTSKLKPKRSK